MNAPSREITGNSATSINLKWDPLTSETLEVAYYTLYMDDGQGVTFTKSYEGTCTDFIVTGLTPGILYSFYVSATNFNGEGAKSQTLSLRSCVAPIDVSPPSLVEATDS